MTIRTSAIHDRRERFYAWLVVVLAVALAGGATLVARYVIDAANPYPPAGVGDGVNQ